MGNGQPASPTSLAKSTAENIKDTLESIVVAFILAFVFRAFIVEAFVIPTGSMAVTLYGNQVTTTCSTCGFEYARGIDTNEEKAGSPINLRCPNCESRSDRIERSQTANPGSGDRILVHKWPFDTGIERLGPRRWEVTVFKDPTDGTTNFIKRLVGLPGEVLEILDGDVYVASFEELEKAGFPLAEMDRLREDVYAYRQGGAVRVADVRRRYEDLNRQLIGHLKIQRKLLQSPRAQEALWVNVYNHDYLPNYASLGDPDSLSDRHLRVGWEPEGPAAAAAWNTSRREITFKSVGTETEPLYVRFDGKDITNFSGYNAELVNRSPIPVGDVRLRFTWFPDSGNGALVMRLNRDETHFAAEVRPDGTAFVVMEAPGLVGAAPIGSTRLDPFPPSKPVEIEFLNVDYVVRLTINGRTAVESTNSQYAPDPVKALTRTKSQQLKTQVRIGARGLECRLRHVVLERDVYYTDAQLQAEPMKTNPYADWPGWGTAGRPIMLRRTRSVGGATLPAEYYMLGDNSPSSKDSRLWWEIGPHLKGLGSEYQVGTVTEDQLIGKAFFVYWPAGYRLSWVGNFGFIPNVGQMRWIR